MISQFYIIWSEIIFLLGPYLLLQSGGNRWLVGEPREGVPFTIFDPIGESVVLKSTQIIIWIEDNFVNRNVEFDTEDADQASIDFNGNHGVSGTCLASLNGSQYLIGGENTNRVSYLRRFFEVYIKY